MYTVSDDPDDEFSPTLCKYVIETIEIVDLDFADHDLFFKVTEGLKRCHFLLSQYFFSSPQPKAPGELIV